MQVNSELNGSVSCSTGTSRTRSCLLPCAGTLRETVVTRSPANTMAYAWHRRAVMVRQQTRQWLETQRFKPLPYLRSESHGVCLATQGWSTLPCSPLSQNLKQPEEQYRRAFARLQIVQCDGVLGGRVTGQTVDLVRFSEDLGDCTLEPAIAGR